MEITGRSRLATILAGILAVVIGGFMIMSPGKALVFIVTFIGWSLIIGGVISFVSALTARTGLFNHSGFYFGVFEVLFGILFVTMPGFFVAWLYVLIGIGVLLSGLDSLRVAVALRRQVPGMSILPIILAIMIIILGIAVICSPFVAAGIEVIATGVMLVVAGVAKVCEGVFVPSTPAA